MRDEGNGCVYRRSILNNNGFESFMRGVNGRICLRHDWCRQSQGNVWHMTSARAEKIDRSV